jgi:hypothetical protein
MARRTRRNKRKRGNGVKLHAPMIAVLALAATVFISYLWLCGRCQDLGTLIRKMEGEYESSQRRVKAEEFKWSRMKSPRNIRIHLSRHNLNMDWPDEDHIVRIPMSERRAFDAEGVQSEFDFARSRLEHQDD